MTLPRNLTSHWQDFGEVCKKDYVHYLYHVSISDKIEEEMKERKICDKY